MYSSVVSRALTLLCTRSLKFFKLAKLKLLAIKHPPPLPSPIPGNHRCALSPPAPPPGAACERSHTLPSAIPSVQFSRSVVSDSLRPLESQHARPPCPSPAPGAYSDSLAPFSYRGGTRETKPLGYSHQLLRDTARAWARATSAHPHRPTPPF